MTLSLFTGPATLLELPVWTAAALYEPPEHFMQPECGPRLAIRMIDGSRAGGRSIQRDVETGLVEIINDLGYMRPVRFVDDGLEYHERGRDIYRIIEGDPMSAEARAERSIGVARHDWRTRVETVSTMTSTPQAFQVTNLLEAFEGSTRVLARTWAFEVPRDLV